MNLRSHQRQVILIGQGIIRPALIVVSQSGDLALESLSSGQRKQTYEKKLKAGRPRSISLDVQSQILKMYWSEFISVRALAKMFGVSHMSVWRLVTYSPRPLI